MSMLIVYQFSAKVEAYEFLEKANESLNDSKACKKKVLYRSF